MTALPRAVGAELMDEPEVDPGELARSLRDLRGVNRWLGGTRVVLRHLGGMIQRLPIGSCTVLDVATGSADIPLVLARWARAHRLRVRVTATDNHPRTLALAREHAAADPDVRVELADALDLPYDRSAFDFALCSTALHHFRDGDAMRVLRELDRVARWGVVVNDLRRSRPALLGARLLAATLWRSHPVTRHVGPLSVRRSFTPVELLDLAGRAGIEGARVHTHLPFRLALVVDRTGGVRAGG
ncbi:MAG TPA: methyltransferase domain-containing protein [Longimicrobiaceae bacterium]|nr:methyltransferase domain-containing protein [Longimicrobiaceae bacterium]